MNVVPAEKSLAVRPAVRQDQRVPRNLRGILSLDDFEIAARKFLPRMVFSYIAGSVESGASLLDAAGSYRDYLFLPRILRDTSSRHQDVSLLGKEYSAPIGIAPLGGAAIAAYRGDLALADAAHSANLPMIMSASSLIRLEDVQRANPRAWFQAYLAGDTSRILPMIDRVEAAGFETLVITGDTPVPGNRENNVRNGYSMPIRPTPAVILDCCRHPRWTAMTLFRTFLLHGMAYFENLDAERGPPMMSRRLARNLENRDQFSWTHLDLIRRRWRGKLVLKGVLSPEDAKRARGSGIDGIILSNHGGRQLDGAIAPLRVLPEIRSELGDFPLMIDGSIRRGTDVLKALALGADFVFVGRSFLFAAAIAGSRGVTHAIDILMAEIDRNMAMLGINDLGELGPQFVRFMEKKDTGNDASTPAK